MKDMIIFRNKYEVKKASLEAEEQKEKKRGRDKESIRPRRPTKRHGGRH